MAEKRPRQPTTKAISRWENEGGTTKNGKSPKRPRNLNQWAKRMVDIATGDQDQEATAPRKRKRQPSKAPAASSSSRKTAK